MGRTIKHLVSDWVKPSFVIFDIRALWRSALSVRVPGCQKLQMIDLTRSDTGCFIASCTHMVTVGVKGIMSQSRKWLTCRSRIVFRRRRAYRWTRQPTFVPGLPCPHATRTGTYAIDLSRDRIGLSSSTTHKWLLKSHPTQLIST